MYRELHLKVANTRLNLMVSPANGPPLLLLHGVIRRWQSYMPLLPHLVHRWQVFGLDFPGHGDSDRLPYVPSAGRDVPAESNAPENVPFGRRDLQEYTVSEYIRIACQAEGQEWTAPVVIYGHSLGAMVAAGVAAELGDRVRAVVLEDPPLETMGLRIRQTALHSYFQGLARFAGTSAPAEQVACELAELEMVDPHTGARQRLGDARDAAQLRFMASCLARLDPWVLDPIIEERWLEGFDWQETFRRVECPALLLQADTACGGMLIDEEAREAASLARRCMLVRVAGCGHNMHWTRTQELANVVNAFLESL